MNSYKPMGLMEILRNSFKIFFRSGKLMLSIASFTLLLSTLFFLSNNFSIKPLISDLLFKQTLLPSTSADSPDFAELLIGIKEDLQTFIGVELIFILAGFIVSLFSNTAIILLSAKSLSGKKLSFKDLLLGVVGSWKRLFITSVFTVLLSIVYIFFVSVTFILVFLTSDRQPLASLALIGVLGILALILYLYLYIVWSLALVISVTEENCYGIEALGKAGRLVEGHRLHGFALNFLYMVISMVVLTFLSLMMVQGKQSPGDQIVTGLFSRTFFCLLSMFELISYTVLYFQCKKTHGEEIEMQDSMEYSQLPIEPLSKDIV